MAHSRLFFVQRKRGLFMAKQKEVKNQVLKLVEFTPKKTVNGQEVFETDPKTGEKVIRRFFSMTLTILGKQHEFKVYPKEKSEREVLMDFYRLRQTNELPVSIIPNRFTNSDGEVITTYVVRATLDETDDIHVVILKPADVDKGRWNMAVKEIGTKYQLPTAYAKVREENYKKAIESRKDQ